MLIDSFRGPGRRGRGLALRLDDIEAFGFHLTDARVRTTDQAIG